MDSDEAEETATATVASTLDRVAGLPLPRFDRVVYNFPYAHVTKFSKEFRQANLDLLRCFFARSAVMLAAGGEVHVRNKTSQPYATEGLEPRASMHMHIYVYIRASRQALYIRSVP